MWVAGCNEIAILPCTTPRPQKAGIRRVKKPWKRLKLACCHGLIANVPATPTLSLPEGQTLNWEDILNSFRNPRRGYPVLVARAVLNDAEHYERLITEFERISSEPDEMAESMFHLHAMHLLAQTREARAFQPLLRIAALPEAHLDEALGDHLTESFHRCVAAVCNDNSLIRDFIENRQHSEWARHIMVSALVSRVVAGDSPGEQLLEWLCVLGDRTLAWIKEQPATVDTRGDELLMDALAGALADIGTPAHLATIRRWWNAGILDPQVASIAWYEKELERPLAERLDSSLSYKEPYIPDAIGYMQTWHCFSDRFHDLPARPPLAGEAAPTNTGFTRPTPKVGRNEPCPCGSGKKYKKCCGA